MRFRTFFSKNSGFSILSVLVGAGLMGGLAMYLASVTKKQHTTQRVAERGAALTELHHKILSILYDSESCTKTLVDTGFGGNDRLYDGRTLQDLKNKDGDAVVQVGVAGRINMGDDYYVHPLKKGIGRENFYLPFFRYQF